MTNEEIVELIKIEKQCVLRADTCDRQCDNCDLVQDSNKLLEMYDEIIYILDVAFPNTVKEYRELVSYNFKLLDENKELGKMLNKNKQPTIGELHDGKFYDGEKWVPIYVSYELSNIYGGQAEYIRKLIIELHKVRKAKKKWKRKAKVYKTGLENVKKLLESMRSPEAVPCEKWGSELKITCEGEQV